MNINYITKQINPKKELFKWGPIEFRMVYGTWFIETILVKVIEYYSWPWPPNLTIFQNGKSVWINEDTALRQEGLKYFRKYILNLKNYKNHWQRWEKWVREYWKKTARLEKIDFKKLSNSEFYKELKSFYDLIIRFWLIVHVPEIANWGGEYLLRRILKKKFGVKAEEYLEILSAPVKFSFFQQEELDLLKICLIKSVKEKQQALKNHTTNYYWILNSYGGNRILNKNYFEKKLKSLVKEKSAKAKISEIKNIRKNNKIRKTRLIKELKLDKRTALIAEQLSQSIWWQDLRKSHIWRMNHFVDKFLKEIAKRTNWQFEELLWCWPRELMNILQGKNINKRKILKRSKYYAFYSEKGKLLGISNKKLVKKLINLYLETRIKNTKKINGLTVSKGKGGIIQGKVKIVNDPFSENKKMKKGDILVTTMTSPDFIIIMRKAKAVITDYGSMVSHAAIVSRELKIPCIVGTKIATRVLKDGDIIEVDANKGMIRIIK